MLYCENCGAELERMTCKECGLVSEELEFIAEYQTDRRFFKDDVREDYIGKMPFLAYPSSPSIRFQNKQPKKSKNFELNKALKSQNKISKKDEDDYYLSAHMDIKSICSYLRLPSTVSEECFNMAKELIKIKKTYFFNGKGEYRYLACIKIACKLNNVYLDDQELVKMSREYDNGPINMRNNQINRNMNREMMDIKHSLKIFITFPEKPIFISYACSNLKIDQDTETEIYRIYSKLYRAFNGKNKLEGYILGIIYLKCKRNGIGLELLEKTFSVSRDTIRLRIKNIKELIR